VAEMKQDELERLLWEQAEGSIAADERARLDALLAADPGAEQRRHGVMAVAEMLGSVAEVAPPPGLQGRITAAVAARQRSHPRASWSALVTDVLAPQWRVRIAWAVVGLVVGMTATALMVADFGHATREDISRYYGAMARPGAADGTVTPLPGGLGTISAGLAGGALALDLDVSREVGGGVRIEVAGGDLAVESFSGTSASRVEVAPEAVAATLEEPGHLSVGIRVPQAAGAITVRIFADGKQILERSLAGPAAPRG
jgi:hypothetical protein